MDDMVPLERDDRLEAAIAAAGRDRVFARAAALGWNRYDWPPKWVWWGIVHEVTASSSRPAPPAPEDRS